MKGSKCPRCELIHPTHTARCLDAQLRSGFDPWGTPLRDRSAVSKIVPINRRLLQVVAAEEANRERDSFFNLTKGGTVMSDEDNDKQEEPINIHQARAYLFGGIFGGSKEELKSEETNLRELREQIAKLLPGVPNNYLDIADDPGVCVPNGAWFVYGWDGPPYPIMLCDSEIEALRYVVDRNVNERVIFWPYGMPWDDLMESQRKAQRER